jgi:hypothetical protein
VTFEDAIAKSSNPRDFEARAQPILAEQGAAPLR